MIHVALPAHLRTLTRVDGDVVLDVASPVTVRRVLDALEAAHPVLRGTIRDHDGAKRRAFVRFFVGEEDWSHADHDDPLPEGVASGDVTFFVIGAMAGG